MREFRGHKTLLHGPGRGEVSASGILHTETSRVIFSHMRFTVNQKNRTRKTSFQFQHFFIGEISGSSVDKNDFQLFDTNVLTGERS